MQREFSRFCSDRLSHIVRNGGGISLLRQSPGRTSMYAHATYSRTLVTRVTPMSCRSSHATHPHRLPSVATVSLRSPAYLSRVSGQLVSTSGVSVTELKIRIGRH